MKATCFTQQFVALWASSLREREMRRARRGRADFHTHNSCCNVTSSHVHTAAPTCCLADCTDSCPASPPPPPSVPASLLHIFLCTCHLHRTHTHLHLNPHSGWKTKLCSSLASATLWICFDAYVHFCTHTMDFCRFWGVFFSHYRHLKYRMMHCFLLAIIILFVAVYNFPSTSSTASIHIY